METELASHLLACGRAFAQARGLEETTIGRLCAKDTRFFQRIREGKSFTARKYDRVIAWFSANWPADTPWPEGVPRPGHSPAPEEEPAS